MSSPKPRRVEFLGKFFADEVRPLINSAGEVEMDRASARFNLVEALAVFAAVEAGMWLFIGVPGAGKGWAGLTGFTAVGYLLIGLAGIWALAVSPRLHGDTLVSFGLPARGEGLAFIRGLRGGRRFAFWIAGVLLCVLLVLNLDFTMRKLGMRGTWIHEFLISPDHIPKAPGYIFSVVAGLALYRIIVLSVIRWDNLLGSVKAMLLTAIPVWGGILLVGALMARSSGDWSMFEKFQWIGWDPRRAFIPRSAHYLFWGMLQQWAFLGYFHTRIRRGVPPGRFGRTWTSLLSGMIFCIIHIPAWPLLPVALVAGCFFGYFYQFDRYRNLFVMGLAHGIGGTMVAFLTPIKMSVGPWSIGR